MEDDVAMTEHFAESPAAGPAYEESKELVPDSEEESK